MAEGFICRRGGGGSNKSTIIVTAPAGSTVTATMGGKVKTAAEKNGQWQFKNCDPGTWTVKASLGASSFTSNVVIPAQGAMLVYYVSVVYRMTPEFTYTGNYQVVDDNDNAITDFANWKGNWKIRFLTSGDLKFTNLYGWNGKLNAFLVGSGGGGGGGGDNGPGGHGGGGYWKTVTITISVNVIYKITIGAGGEGGVWYESDNKPASTNGNKTVAFGNEVNGGNRGTGFGPKAGVNGTGGAPTGEFGINGTKYSSKGVLNVAGKENTGAGGGGGSQSGSGKYGQSGGAGIVIIRNAR